MIELEKIRLAFGQRTLIEGASAHFRCGEMTALLGRNGAGKSTLLRAMASLGGVQGGEILLEHRPLATFNSLEIARRVAFVNTEHVDVESLTARELVAIGRAPYTNWSGRLCRDDHRKVEEAIAIVGIADLAEREVDTLSDGECQRVMIARALAQETPVILLDEPTAFLDLPNRYELCTLLQRLAHECNKCIIFSTHELDIALSLADNIALVESPALRYMPTEEMVLSGLIERLFDSRHVTFDAHTQSLRLNRG